MRYEVIVTDKNGKVVSKESRVCKSFLTNFVKWIATFFSAPPWTYGGSQSLNNTSGAGKTIPATLQQLQAFFGAWSGLVGSNLLGIVVGTSATAVAPDDYALKAIIAHGTGAGQLLHNVQTQEAVQVVGAVSSVRATRTFTNNSGGTITVREIGWYWGQHDSVNSYQYFCGVRDVLGTPKEVADGLTLTVRYTFSVTT